MCSKAEKHEWAGSVAEKGIIQGRWVMRCKLGAITWLMETHRYRSHVGSLFAWCILWILFPAFHMLFSLAFLLAFLHSFFLQNIFIESCNAVETCAFPYDTALQNKGFQSYSETPNRGLSFFPETHSLCGYLHWLPCPWRAWIEESEFLLQSSGLGTE